MSICEQCPRSCCVDFKISLEPFDPERVKEILHKYPFIKKSSWDVVLLTGGVERVVGIYNCDRFNKQTGLCKDYDTQPRPPFCANTGKVIKGYDLRPHKECNFVDTNDR